LFWRPEVLGVVAGILALFALVPGFPALPFILAAAAAGAVAYIGGQMPEEASPRPDATTADGKKPQEQEDRTRPTPLDLLELEVGYELIPLVDSDKDGLVERIRALRRQFASEKGFLVPQIHIRDNLRQGSREYTILVKGVPAGKGELKPGRLLAMGGGRGVEGLQGDETREPAFGLPALWIAPADRERAEMMGYTVVDPETVLITHVSEVVKRYAPVLLTRQDVQRLLDSLAQDHPRVVEELVPHHLTIGGVQKVLQNLLREEVPIRDLLTIIETLADHAPQTKSTDELTEYVRQALCRTITSSYSTAEGIIPLMTVDPQIEKLIRDSVQEGTALDPQAAQRIISGVQRAVETFTAKGLLPVLLTTAGVRRHLQQLIARYLAQITILSHSEITEGVKIQSLGVIRWNHGN
jgi:flagellar biosynthesis protein FlhA